MLASRSVDVVDYTYGEPATRKTSHNHCQGLSYFCFFDVCSESSGIFVLREILIRLPDGVKDDGITSRDEKQGCGYIKAFNESRVSDVGFKGI